MKNLTIIGLILIVSLLGTFAQSKDKTLVLTDRNNLAIKGYDPVAYFTDNAAVKGSRQFRAEHNGATYYFSSEKNKNLFTGEPEKYTPQFGGYCGYAVSQNSLAKGNPRVFEVRNGRLILQLSERVKKIWDENPDGYLKDADKNWPGLVERHGK